MFPFKFHFSVERATSHFEAVIKGSIADFTLIWPAASAIEASGFGLAIMDDSLAVRPSVIITIDLFDHGPMHLRRSSYKLFQVSQKSSRTFGEKTLPP